MMAAAPMGNWVFFVEWYEGEAVWHEDGRYAAQFENEGAAKTITGNLGFGIEVRHHPDKRFWEPKT